MNIDNFKIARGWVAEQDNLDMENWILKPGGFTQVFILEENEEFPCGTAACLAGTIAIRTGEIGSVRLVARCFLGLSKVQADKLFCNPEQYGKTALCEVDKNDVLAKLDEIITTGEFE